MKILRYQSPSIRRTLQRPRVLLCLDYDGTLVPIAAKPSLAKAPQYTKTLLRRLSNCKELNVALISGRSLKDLRSKLKVKGLIYVGNHGLECRGPGVKFNAPLPGAYFQNIQEIYSQLRKELKDIRGIVIENKRYSLSVHYRLVAMPDEAKLKEIFWKAVAKYLKYKKVVVREGKKVWEIRPPIVWHKGKIVLWLLSKYAAQRPFKPVLPIYIGDDVTDEDAFRSLRKRGLTIFVGAANSRRSEAKYSLADPAAVHLFLNALLEARS